MEFGNIARRDMPAPYNYLAGLQPLKLSLPNYSVTVTEQSKQIPPAAASLFTLVETCDGRLKNDRYSTSLLHRYMGIHGAPYTAAITTADGSCLFHSASLLICGKKELLILSWIIETKKRLVDCVFKLQRNNTNTNNYLLS